MEMTNHYRALEKMYQSSSSVKDWVPVDSMIIEQGKCTIKAPVRDTYFHALNAIHGATYFKLLDDSSFFAVNSLVSDVFVLTTSFNISIIRPVQSGQITAVGSARFAGKNLFIAESTLYDENNKEVAFGSGHFMKSRVELSPDIGYNL